MNKNAPIGIFDSGIGGLTVARAIHRLLPKEQLIYFGDTAHLPYGEKSPVAIRSYSNDIASFLVRKKCKAIVIACNTASSVAFRTVKKHTGDQAIVFNVIDPVVEYVANRYDKGKIGIIGTKGTINSRIYVKRLQKLNAKLKVTSLATPLLVPMIEEGYFNNNISQTIIHAYLSKKSFHGIHALVLGCTHFPLIEEEVSSFYPKGQVEIINSAKVVAEYLQKKLSQRELLKAVKGKSSHQFFVSDYTASFEESTKQFFGKSIQLKKQALWE